MNPTSKQESGSPSIPISSVRRRYASTLLAHCSQLAFSAITAGVVPRALGPTNYGNYSFLINTASAIRGVLGVGTGQAFFTFSSQKRSSGPLTKLYGIWLLGQLAILLAVIALGNIFGLLPKFWPGQRTVHIILVSILEWLVFVGLAFRQLADSKGLTVRTQFIAIGISILNTAGLIGLSAAGWLNFNSYLLLAYLSAVGTCGALGLFLLVFHKDLTWAGPIKEYVREHIHRWWQYASPLIVYSTFGAILGYAETYIIQRFYGSSEQAYFSLANHWSALVLVFTSSAMSIYWREIANMLAKKDIKGAANIYERFNRRLFSLAIVLAFWLCLNARILISSILGTEFLPAIPVLMVTAFYPVQQTFGQLSGVAFLASERTTQYRNLGIAFSVPGLLLTYLLLAPKTAPIPGLNLGAFGAALKMVGYGLVTVQFYDWSNCRFLGISFKKIFFQKIGFTLMVSFFAFLVFKGLGGILQFRMNFQELWVVFITSVIYFGLIGTCIYVYPNFIGLDANEVKSIKDYLQKGFNGKIDDAPR